VRIRLAQSADPCELLTGAWAQGGEYSFLVHGIKAIFFFDKYRKYYKDNHHVQLRRHRQFRLTELE
jgi:hypothetical protein